MNKINYIFFVILISIFIFIEISDAKSNFVTTNLSNDVTVDLPGNWSVMSANKRITLDAWRESVNAAQKLSDIENELAFAANYYDDIGNTAGTFAIRFYPNLEITELEAIAGGNKFIKELDEGIKQKYKLGLEAGGGKLISWLGTVKQNINGSTYFISKNRQMSPSGDRFRNILVRYLNAGKSFTIIISYREDQEFYLKPICTKIIGSIRHGK